MCGNRRILEKCKKYMNKFGEYAAAGTEGDFRIQAGYGIMNARHKRKGKALPKPGRSLTAAIAARCAAKTWYNERSPRQAGVTCLAGSANIGVYKERKTHPRNGEPLQLSSPGRRDHGSMCGKAILPAQGNMDGQGTIPLAGRARLVWRGLRMLACKGKKNVFPKRGARGKERQFPMKR